MLKILKNLKIPSRVAIAVSGGVDSMAVLDFLRRSRDVTVLHYNHGTGQYADLAQNLVASYCFREGITLIVGRNREKMPKGVSAEAWWRDKRYEWFDSLDEARDLPIVTAHHLDDVVENWIFTSLNGNPFLIPSRRDRFIRPFLSTEKKAFISWCNRKDVPFLLDPSNLENKHRRNYIRNVMMPHVEEINPGIRKTIMKKVINEDNRRHW